MKKKWISALLLSIVALLLTIFFFTTKAIENRVTNLNLLDTKLISLKEKLGISVRYTSVHYELFRGLILTNVQFSNNTATQESVILTVDELAFQFTFSSLLSENPTISSLILYNGKFNLNQKTSPRDQLDQIITFLKNESIDIELRNITIKETKESAVKDIHFSATIKGQEPEIKAWLNYKNSKVLTIQGNWKSEPLERLYINLHSLPLAISQLILPYLSTNTKIKWKDGNISGQGSIDLTSEGYALHLRGRFQNVAFLIEPSKFEVKDVEGSYEQMIVGSFTDGMRQLTMKLRSPFIDHNIEIDSNFESKFSGTLRLESNRNISLPYPISSAEVEYSIGLKSNSLQSKFQYGTSKTITPDLHIWFKQLTLDFNEAFQSIPKITIVDGHIDGSDKLTISIPGLIGNSKFHLKSDTVPNFRINNGEYIWGHQSNFVLDIEQASIDTLLIQSELLANDILHYVNSSGAVRSEDFGPTWENKFFNSATYRQFIEPAVLNGEIRFNKFTDIASSPLSIQFRHRIPITEFIINKPFDSMSIEGYYRIHFDQALPLHDAKFEIHDQGQPFYSHLFAESNLTVKPVESFDLSYTFQSEGVYLADLYYKSVTALNLKSKHLPIERDYRLDLISRLLNIHSAPLRYIDLDLQRHSSGSLFKPIILRIDIEGITINGNGEFNIYEGGFIRFHSFNQKNASQDRFEIRIRPDRVWIPSS